MDQRGWIKQHRTELDMLRDNSAYLVWNFFKMTAAYLPSKTAAGRPLLPGELEVTVKTIEAYTSLPDKTIRRAIKRLSKRGRLSVFGGRNGMRVSITNWERYQGQGGGGVQESVQVGVQVGVHPSIIEEVRSKKEEVSGKRPDDPRVKEIVSHLNQKAGTRFEPTTKNTIRLIRARLKKHTVEDLKAVIDLKIKDWLYDEKMFRFLRPDTLFNETKFEGYHAGVKTVGYRRAHPSHKEWVGFDD